MKHFIAITLFLYGTLLHPQKKITDYIDFYDIKDIDFEILNDPAYKTYYTKSFDKKKYLDNYFKAWKTNNLSISDKDYNQFFVIDTTNIDLNCYAGNYQLYSKKIISEIFNNINTNKNNNKIIYGITTETANLRRFPTDELCFKNIRNAGEGYPFDYFQNSNLWTATPIAILKTSKDGLWYFVNSHNNKGWIKKSKVAIITQEEKEKIINSNFVTVTKDNIVLKNQTNSYKVFIGTLLPLVNNKILLPKKNIDNYLLFDSIPSNNNALKEFPITFNPKNVKHILTELHHYKYTWGGLNNGRDCSSTLKDFFTPFALWLPRDSKQQIKQGGQIDLIGNKKEKLQTIKNNAIPFLTGIYKKGHIVLYLGKNKNNKSIIFQNVWGVKGYIKNRKLKKLRTKREIFGLFGLHKKNKKQTEIRFNIGNAVFTPFEFSKKLEKEIKGLKTESYLNNFMIMTIFN